MGESHNKLVDSKVNYVCMLSEISASDSVDISAHCFPAQKSQPRFQQEQLC